MGSDEEIVSKLSDTLAAFWQAGEGKMEIICKHLQLKKQKVGEFTFYKCIACPRKFKASLWDGKVEVIRPSEKESHGQS
jgi:DNA-directed RNA polymerase subunit M/transcription elongation factor TFIIS